MTDALHKYSKIKTKAKIKDLKITIIYGTVKKCTVSITVD